MDLDGAFARAFADAFGGVPMRDARWLEPHATGRLSPREAGRDAVLVVFADTADWRGRDADARDMLDDAERDRAARQRQPAEREVRHLAYALRRWLLARLLGRTPASLQLARDALGHSRLAGGGAHASLSHAGTVVAVAADAIAPVGIDLEPRTRAAEMAGIAHEVCDPGELARLHADPEALLDTWVRKEAFLKAEGVGLSRAMTGFAAPADARLPSRSLPGRIHALRMLDPGPAWAAAIASAPARPVRQGWLRPPHARVSGAGPPPA